MELSVQIISLIFSFFYGVFLGLFLNVNHDIIYNINKFIKYIGSFLVIFIGTLIYFLILRKISYVNMHIYCLIVLSCGFWLYNVVVKHFKK